MAAGAHAASGPQLAHPSGLPCASPEAVGTREQWQPVKRGPRRKGVAVVGQSALASGHLSPDPAHGAKALGTRHSRSSFLSPLAGTILVHFSFTGQHTLPGPCSWPQSRLCPCHGFSVGHEWAYRHTGNRPSHCVPVSSEGCQALDWPWKTRPGQIENSESYKARCHLSSHHRVSYGQIMPFSRPKQNKSQTKTAEISVKKTSAS
ncbi:hypothetical protein DUI87_29124 [Hirundo rustica rustica]|uniref:Uncharacterized protein n=1 Tax=Hirundo rustica rustica TaxID=333673 RepID=A0A3M0JHS9_HIRRU|nr:hypothetical protein DUI87_29124 [Hirundo rustica rustica]